MKVLLFLLLCLSYEVLCFVITSPKQLPAMPLNALTQPSEEVLETKREAIDALQKLLSKKQQDIKETEQLIKTLEGLEECSPDTQYYSTARSLLSGFDYGFVSRSEGPPPRLESNVVMTEYEGPPENIWDLGRQQLVRNWRAIRGEYLDEDDIVLSPVQEQSQSTLEKLTLNSTEIYRREIENGPIEAPFIIKIPYIVVCYLLDEIFERRYVFSRFFLLETVARMPYFSYISMLHLYETLGFWRRSADVKRIHFAEEMNEFRHLLIMESLGGDQSWWVRFAAQHAAIVYFWVLCVLWAVSPTLSYRFSELLETHAVHTYGTFMDENEAVLKELPPPRAAVEYYAFGSYDVLYDEIQTSSVSKGIPVRI